MGLLKEIPQPRALTEGLLLLLFVDIVLPGLLVPIQFLLAVKPPLKAAGFQLASRESPEHKLLNKLHRAEGCGHVNLLDIPAVQIQNMGEVSRHNRKVHLLFHWVPECSKGQEFFFTFTVCHSSQFRIWNSDQKRRCHPENGAADPQFDPSIASRRGRLPLSKTYLLVRPLLFLGSLFEPRHITDWLKHSPLLLHHSSRRIFSCHARDKDRKGLYQRDAGGGKERKLESIIFWETNTQGWVDHSLHVMPQSNTEGGWVLG